MNKELSIGPIHINLADLQWPSGIQDTIHKINSVLLAIFALYALGIGFSGLAILLCLAALFLSPSRGMILLNFVVVLLAALFIAIGRIITTVAAQQGAGDINDLGEHIGVSASAGQRFISISWAAFAVMGAATLYWVTEFCFHWRAKNRVLAEKHDKSVI